MFRRAAQAAESFADSAKRILAIAVIALFAAVTALVVAIVRR